MYGLVILLVALSFIGDPVLPDPALPDPKDTPATNVSVVYVDGQAYLEYERLTINGWVSINGYEKGNTRHIQSTPVLQGFNRISLKQVYDRMYIIECVGKTDNASKCGNIIYVISPRMYIPRAER